MEKYKLRSAPLYKVDVNEVELEGNILFFYPNVNVVWIGVQKEFITVTFDHEIRISQDKKNNITIQRRREV